jgi:hypothetical protein
LTALTSRAEPPVRVCCASLSLWVLHSKDASSARDARAFSLPELDRICEKTRVFDSA